MASTSLHYCCKGLLVLVVIGTLLDNVASKELPSYVPICKRNDPHLSECIRKATVTLQPYIAKGIKELNIPSLQPLTIPMIKLEQGTSAVNYKVKLSNVKIYGLGGYKFQSVRFDQDNLKIFGNVDVPDIYLDSDYVIDGRALLVPIKGNGDFKANFTDCKAVVDMQCELTKRKAGDFLKVTETKVNFSIGGAKAHFSNLFNGDSVLSTATNTFLNENSKDIVEEVKPAVEAVAAMIVEDVANNFAKVVPYSKLLPIK